MLLVLNNWALEHCIVFFVFTVETEHPPMPNLFPAGAISLLVGESLTLVCNVSIPKDTHISFKFSYRTEEEEVSTRPSHISIAGFELPYFCGCMVFFFFLSNSVKKS